MYDSALSRHIQRRHKDQERVQRALELPRKERIRQFELFKNEGILKTNLQKAGDKNAIFEKNRFTKSNKKNDIPVMCNNCKKFLSKQSMSRHRMTCQQSNSYPIEMTMLKDPDPEMCDLFKMHILCTMRNDEIGLKAKSDRAILTLGLRLFDKTKKRDDNIMGSRKDVRSKMRNLAHLYKNFENKPAINKKFNNAKDLFLISNFTSLRAAIDDYSIDDNDNLKAGAKTNLHYLLIKAAKIFKATALVEAKSLEADIFEEFLCVLQNWQV